MYKQKKFNKVNVRGYLPNRIKLWASLHLLDRPSYPLHAPNYARIEVTNRCNLSCKMCLHQLLTEIGDMDFTDYKKIINSLPKDTVRVNPTGFGEPLLHEDICEMVQFARNNKRYFEIFTNATVLDMDMSKNLLDSGINSLHFSLDGASKETYEYIRTGAKFNKVIQNIEYFMNLRKNIKDPPHVTMRVVIMKENLHESFAFIELARKLGVKDILFQALQYLWDIGLSKNEQSLHFMKEIADVRQRLKEAQERAKSYGIQLRLPNIEYVNKVRCTQPWYQIVINWQGFVNPCLTVYDAYVGNILTQPFRKIWRGREFINWREKMKSSAPPISCINCAER